MNKKTNNKTIMFITGSLGGGGLERIVSNVSNHYAKKGWNVIILLLLAPDVFYKIDDRIKIISMSNKKINGRFINVIPWIHFIRKNINTYNPSHIVTMTFKMGSLTRIACRNKNTRIIVREINDPSVRSKLMNKITDHYVGKCDGIIFQTEWEKQCHSKKCQKIGKIIVNPVLIPEKASEIKNNVIVTTGRLDLKQKSYDELIEAFSIVQKKYPDVTLELYGDGPDADNLKEMVKRLNLEKFVIFKGMQKNVHSKIASASMFVLSTKYEGLSNSLLEAFLMGIPCISSNWNGADEIIDNMKNGLLYDKGNYKQLAECIIYYIENYDIALQFANNAMNNIGKYDINNVIKQWESLIENPNYK